MTRFYIGEEVIALPEANERYIVTRKGWVGTVVGILDVHMIQVKDEDPHAYFMDSVKRFEAFPEDIPAIELEMINLSIKYRDIYEERIKYRDIYIYEEL